MSAPEKQTALGELPRAALSLFVCACLFGMAALFFYSGSKLFAVAAALPALLGLLVFYGFVHSLLAAGTPPTTISLSREPVPRGEPITVTIRQTGPVVLESLRANLICERIERPTGRSRAMTYPCQLNFFDSGRREVPRMDTTVFAAPLTVPADLEPSTFSPELKILWRIEIWGKVVGRADFMRPFDLEVV